MTEMSPAEAVFFAALERVTAADRAAYLDAACAGDPALRALAEHAAEHAATAEVRLMGEQMASGQREEIDEMARLDLGS